MSKLITLFFLLQAFVVICQVPNGPVVEINSGNPRFPFPQFINYAAGENLAANNPEGVVHAEMEQDIRDAYQIMMNRARVEPYSLGGTPYLSFNNFVQHPDLRGGYGTFVTEGDGYALIAAAYMADKKTFNGLWMWCHDFRLTHVKRYIDCENLRFDYNFGRYAELWDVYTTEPSNEDRATDGTVDYAIALLMAYRQWGEHSGIIDDCGNEINYKTEALNFINSMVEPFLNTDRNDDLKFYMMGVVGLDGYMKSGNKWTELTDWAQGTLQDIMSGIGVSMQGTGVDPTGRSANVHWINGRTVTRDFFDYHASAYFKEFGDFLQEVYDENNPNYITTEFNIAQCRRAEASTDWLMEQAMGQGLIPYIGGISECANDGSSVTFHNVGEGEDFRLPMRNITNYIWHGTPNYRWDPVNHMVVDGTQNGEQIAANVLSQFLWEPGNNCESLGNDPTGMNLQYSGVSVLRQAYDATGTPIDSYYTNYTLGSSAPAPVASGDIELAAKMYRQQILEWDVEDTKEEAEADPNKRYLGSTPKYFHGYYRTFGLLMLTGNYIPPTGSDPIANLKCYVDLDKTYGPRGDILTYTVSYRNYASVAAENSVLTFTVPDEVEFVSCEGGGAFNEGTRQVTWDLGEIPGFQTGGIDITRGEFTVVAKVVANSGRFCPTSSIICSNGTGWTSNEFPNNISATMERNCYDIVAKALVVNKISNLPEINPGMPVEYTIDFTNNAEAGYLDGGRPGTRATFAIGFSGTPANSLSQQLYFRLYHAAEEPYINYANYRLSYYLKSDTRGITPALGSEGWYINSWIDEGGPLVTQWDEIILPFGHEAQNNVNQRIIIGFPSALAAPAAHLYNQTGNDHRIHKGVNFPLKLSASITDGNSVMQNFTDDWSYEPGVDVGAQTQDKMLFFPITPDWSDIINFPAGQDVDTWHAEECRTIPITLGGLNIDRVFDRVMIEEFDGYGWRRVFGTSPFPGRPATDVVMEDTIPDEFVFDSFIQEASFGTTEHIEENGYSIVRWTNSSLLPGQEVRIRYRVIAKDETTLGGCPINIETQNIAWLSSVGEAAQSDTADVLITCEPVVIPPEQTTMTKTSDKLNYEVDEEVVYSIEFEQTAGSISEADLMSSNEWTSLGGRPFPTFGGGQALFSSQAYNYMFNNYAHGVNGTLNANISRTNVSESFTFFFRASSANNTEPGTAGFQGIAISIVPASNWQGLGLLCYDGSTKLNPIYGAEDQIPESNTTLDFSFVLRNDSLIVWLNKSTFLTPTVIYRVTTMGAGYVGIYGGKVGGGNYVNGTLNSWSSHFDSAFDLQVIDPIPNQLSFISADNSGVLADTIVKWPVQRGPVLYGTIFSYSWTATLDACPPSGSVLNTAYANMYGREDRSLGANATISCGQTCTSPQSVSVIGGIVCEGEASSITTAVIPIFDFYYKVTGDTLIPFQLNSNFELPAGNYTLTVADMLDTATCFLEEDFVVVELILDPPLTDTAIVLVGEPVPNLTARGEAGAIFSWYRNGIVDATGSSYASGITAEGTYRIPVTLTVDGCESDSAYAILIITDCGATPPQVSHDSICLGEATSWILQTNATNGAWFHPDSVISDTTFLPSDLGVTYDITIDGPGVYSMQSAVFDATFNCWSEPSTAYVVVIDTPSPTITINDDLCYAQTTNAATASPPGGVLAINGATTIGVIPANLSAGDYTVSYSIEEDGCFGLVNQIVTVFQPEVPETEEFVTLQEYELADSSRLWASASGTIFWEDALGNSLGSGENIDHGITTTGTTSFFVYNEVNGCESEKVNVTVTVDACAVPAPDFVVRSQIVCEGIAANDFVAYPNAIADSVSWYDNLGNHIFTGDRFNPGLLESGNHIYTVTQTIGCEGIPATVSLVVNDNPNPTIEISGLCFGSMATVSITPSGGTFFIDNIEMPFTTFEVNESVLTPGIHDFKYEYTDINNCFGDTVIQAEAIQVTAPVAPNVVEFIDTAHFELHASGNGTIYWLNTDGTSAGTGLSLNVPATTSVVEYNYLVFAENDGCYSDTIAVTYATTDCDLAPPSVIAPAEICQGETFAYANASGETGAVFHWYQVGNPAFVNTGNTFSPAGILPSGTYHYYVTQETYCESGAAYVDFSVKETRTAIPVIPSLACEGTPVQLAIQNISGVVEWMSDTTSGTPIASNTQLVVPVAGNNAMFVHQVYNGCVGPWANASFTANAKPAVPVVSDGMACQGNSATLSATPLAGASISWHQIPGGSSIGGNNEYTTLIQGTYYAVQTLNGCQSDPVAVQAMFNSNPLPPVTTHNEYCFGDLPANLSATVALGQKIRWYEFVDTSGFLFEGAILSPSAAGTYYAVAWEGECASIPQPAILEEIRPNNISLNYNGQDICRTSLPRVIVPSPQGSIDSIVWNLNGQAMMSGVQPYSLFPATVGAFTLNITPYYRGCPGATLSPNGQVVDAPAPPVLVPLMSNVLCGSDAYPSLVSTSANVQWEFSGITWVKPQLDSADYARYLDEGGNVIKAYTVLPDDNNCKSDPETISIDFLEKPLMLDQADRDYCIGESSEIVIRGHDLSYDYLWSLGGMVIDTAISLLPDASIAGEYVYHIQPVNNSCAGDSYEMIVSVHPNPYINIVGDSTVCAGTGTARYYHADGDNLSVDWDLLSGEAVLVPIKDIDDISIDFVTGGINTIMVKAVNDLGCENSDTLDIIALNPVQVDLTARVYDEGKRVEFRNRSTVDTLFYNDRLVDANYIWRWDFGIEDTIITSADTIQYQSYPPGIHTVQLYALSEEYGCSGYDSEEIDVRITSGLWVPNAFAPEHGASDVSIFQPKGYNLAKCQLYIYDTWGNLVFYGDNVVGGEFNSYWDGYSEGKLLKGDVYIWKIEAEFLDGTEWKGQKAKNGQVSNWGNVILIR